MKATLKGKFEPDKTSAVASLAAPAGDLRLKASFTDATFARGPSLDGLTLSLEKPGSFIVDLNVPKKDVRFQFMSSASVLEKPVSLTYTHGWRESRTAVDWSVAFDPANKVAVSYSLGSPGCRIKYVYAHGEMRRTVFEPVFDTGKGAWDFAVARKFEGGDDLKATYHTSSNVLGLEWTRDSKTNVSFKISASYNLADQQKPPKIMAESTWNYEV